MKSEQRYHKETHGFHYRGVGYEISKVIGKFGMFTEYYCAYFMLDTSRIHLILNLKGDVGVDMEDLPMSIFSASRFLGSKAIDEIEKVAHFAFTFAEVKNITRREGNNLVCTEFVKVGVDYNHIGDKEAGHTLESVGEDCKKVIDKIHDMGLFKEVENGA